MILRMGDAVKSLGRSGVASSPAEVAARLANQGMCNQAADAIKRQSPAAPNLVAQCGNIRRANILAGRYYTDAMTPDDPAYRVALTDAGEAVVSKNPTLQQMRAQLPVGDQQRGFTMAQGVRAGSMDPAFPAWVAAGLARSPELLKGFTDALASNGLPAQGPGLTQATQPSSGPLDSIPKPVLIGGAIAAAVAVGLVAYKLTR